MVEVYAFNPKATKVPWEGGPLFLPRLQPWPADEAKALTKTLVAWYFWAHRQGRADLKRNIVNNLQSRGLGDLTQFWPGGPDDLQEWARGYGHAFGKVELRRLLKTQGLLSDPSLKQILDSLN